MLMKFKSYLNAIQSFAPVERNFIRAPRARRRNINKPIKIFIRSVIVKLSCRPCRSVIICRCRFWGNEFFSEPIVSPRFRTDYKIHVTSVWRIGHVVNSKRTFCKTAIRTTQARSVSARRTYRSHDDLYESFVANFVTAHVNVRRGVEFL